MPSGSGWTVVENPTKEFVKELAPHMSDDQIAELFSALPLCSMSRRYIYVPNPVGDGAVLRYCLSGSQRECLLHAAGARWIDRAPYDGARYDYVLTATHEDYEAATAADKSVSRGTVRPYAAVCLFQVVLDDHVKMLGGTVDTLAAVGNYAEISPIAEIVDRQLGTLFHTAEQELQFCADCAKFSFSFCGYCGGGIVHGTCVSCFRKFSMPHNHNVLWTPRSMPYRVSEYLEKQGHVFAINPKIARANDMRDWSDKVLTAAPCVDVGYHKPLRNISMET